MVEFGILHLIAIMLGGALGGMARFAVTTWLERIAGGAFPWGTLAVNISGSALIGALAAFFPPATALSLPWALLVIGLLGSYTTVSSFSLQTLVLARTGRPVAALANILASTGLCLAAAAIAFTALSGAF
jgi:CrcB protein